MHAKSELLVAPCSYKAAKYAAEKWHYTKSLSSAANVYFGVWERGVFIGAIVFARGANNSMHKPYNLQMTEICELTRIALTNHVAPVSQIMMSAIKQLSKRNVNLRLIVSYADPEQGHNGSIYQATNWVYTGETKSADEYIVNGVRRHARSINNIKPISMTARQFVQQYPNSSIVKGSQKRRYLFPLDRAMRKQIAPLAKPYPKRKDKESQA